MYEQQFNPYAANVAIVKDYFKSGKVLFLGILHLLSLAISVLTVLIVPVNQSTAQFLDYLSQMGIDVSSVTSGSYDAFLSGAGAGTVISILLSSVVTILTAVAFIIIFAKSRNNDPSSNPVAGVTILHVLAVITFVFAVIATVLIVLIYVIGVIIGLNVSSNNNAAIAAVIIFGVILAIALFLLLFITASIKNFYRSVKYSLTTVRLQSKGAVAYGVFCIIGAVMYGFSLIGEVILLIRGGFSADSLITVLSVLLLFVMLIFNASLALGYNRHIKRHTLGYSNIPYGAAPNAAYPSDAQPPYTVPRQDYGDNYQSYNAPMQQNPYNESVPKTEATSQESKPAYCPNCGAPTDGSAFCSNCGHKL